MSSNLMSTELGGEADQYQSQINPANQPHTTQAGSLGTEKARTNEASEQLRREKAERDDQTAANARYGRQISEQGMGGQTTDIDGSARQEGYGDVAAQEDDADAAAGRSAQGYGGGSGVGA